MSGLIKACKHKNNALVYINTYITYTQTPTLVYETCSPVLKAKNTVLEEVYLKAFGFGFSDYSVYSSLIQKNNYVHVHN